MTRPKLTKPPTKANYPVEYKAWYDMTRYYPPKYAWRTFREFLRDFGPRPSRSHAFDFGRKRWRKQSRRRGVLVHVFGESRTIVAWSREFGISPKTLQWRLSHGWDPETAILLPVDECRRRKET